MCSALFAYSSRVAPRRLSFLGFVRDHCIPSLQYFGVGRRWGKHRQVHDYITIALISSQNRSVGAPGSPWSNHERMVAYITIDIRFPISGFATEAGKGKLSLVYPRSQRQPIDGVALYPVYASVCAWRRMPNQQQAALHLVAPFVVFHRVAEAGFVVGTRVFGSTRPGVWPTILESRALPHFVTTYNVDAGGCDARGIALAV